MIFRTFLLKAYTFPGCVQVRVRFPACGFRLHRLPRPGHLLAGAGEELRENPG